MICMYVLVCAPGLHQLIADYLVSKFKLKYVDLLEGQAAHHLELFRIQHYNHPGLQDR